MELFEVGQVGLECSMGELVLTLLGREQMAE